MILNYFAMLKKAVKALGVSVNVTRRELSLGARDSWSGWRAKSWAESDIEMVIIPKTSARLVMLAGVFPRQDALGFTNDTVAVGDQIKDKFDNYYTIDMIDPYTYGDVPNYSKCDMSKETMYQADFGATTWSKTRSADPRYRTKDWADTYLRPEQITKDDDSTLATYGTLFNNPPYPMCLEFRGDSNMNGLYVIDQPTISTPIIDSDHLILGYSEEMPIHIMTVDSTACTGTALNWKMEAELRYACETYVYGSVRLMIHRRNYDVNLGQIIYDTLLSVSYKRLKTV